MRLLKNIGILLVIIIAGWWILGKLNVLPSIGNPFKKKEVVIDQTPLIIEQIKPLAQLVTITAYTEVTADSTTKTTVGERLRSVLNPFSMKVAMQKQLIVVGKVVVHAGVDLKKLTPADIYISNDSVSIQLPPAEILDVIVNPSDTDIFLEEGRWDNAAVVNLKTKMGANAVQELKARGVLYQAEERAREVLLNFLRAAGFSKINLQKSRLG